MSEQPPIEPDEPIDAEDSDEDSDEGQEPVVDHVFQKVEAEDDVEAVVRKGKALADQDDPVAEDLAGLT